MGWWFIVGVILICITLYLLKNTKISKSEKQQDDIWYKYKISYQDFKIKVWHLVCIVGIYLIPIFNLMAFVSFIIFYISYISVCWKEKEEFERSYDLSESYIKLKKESYLYRTLLYIGKILTKDLL